MVQGLSKFFGFRRKEKLDFEMSDYETELREHVKKCETEKVFEAIISESNDKVIRLLKDGEELPYSIAKNFRYIPMKVLPEVSRIEWVLSDKESLMNLVDCVYAMVYRKDLEWKIYFTENLYPYLSDDTLRSGRNLKYYTSKYMVDRFVFHKFQNEEGQDGSLKPIWEF